MKRTATLSGRAHRGRLILAAAVLGCIADSHVNAQTAAPSGTVITIAGNGSSGYGGDVASALSATLNSPLSLAVSPSGAIYFSDGGNYRIRRIDAATGIISTAVGDGTAANVSGSDGDGGPATSAQIATVNSVAIDGARNALYFADLADNKVRKVDLNTGIVTTYAGQGVLAYGPAGNGGLATSASLAVPSGVSVDGVGNLSIADNSDSLVRQVNATTGVISTIGSIATPNTVSADAAGNVFVLNTDNTNTHRVYRIDAISGAVTTVAGGGATTPGAGNATDMRLSTGTDVAITPDGTELYIADANRVLGVQLSTGLLSTIAGTGTNGFSGDGGAATDANFGTIGGIGVSPAGELLISDAGNHRVRYVVPDNINLDSTAQTELHLPLVSSLVGNLFITNNPKLSVLDAPALSSVGGLLTVSGDGVLNSINLGAIQNVGGNIDIHGNSAAGTINLGAVATVSGNVLVNDNSSAGSIALGSLTDAGGNVDVSGNGSAGTINLASLVNVGGNLNISANAGTGHAILGALTSVGGSLTVESTGSGAFNVANAVVGGNTMLTLTGYITAAAQTAGGQTHLIMHNAEATMDMLIYGGSFNAGLPVPFTANKIANGPSEFVSGQTATPLETYAFAFDTPNLDFPAQLDFELNFDAMDAIERQTLLEFIHAGGKFTIASRADAPGSDLQLFNPVGPDDYPTPDQDARVIWLDASGNVLDSTGTIDPSVIRFESQVDHFSTYSVVALSELPEPTAAGLLLFGVVGATLRRNRLRH